MMSNRDYPTQPPSLADQDVGAREEYERRVQQAGYSGGKYEGYILPLRNIDRHARMVIRSSRGDLMEVEYQRLVLSPYMSVTGRLKEMWDEHREAKAKLTIWTEVAPVWQMPAYEAILDWCRQLAALFGVNPGEATIDRAASSLMSRLREPNDDMVDVVAHIDSEIWGQATGRVRAKMETKERGSAEETKPLETAETSAIGRAAGVAGYGLFPGAGLAPGEDVRSAIEREAVGGVSQKRLDDQGRAMGEDGQPVEEETLLKILVAQADETEKRWLMAKLRRLFGLDANGVVDLVTIGEHPESSFAEIIDMVRGALERRREAVLASSASAATPVQPPPEEKPVRGPEDDEVAASRSDAESEAEAARGVEAPEGDGTPEPERTDVGNAAVPAQPEPSASPPRVGRAGGGGQVAQFFAEVARSQVRVEEAMARLGVSRPNEFPDGAEGAREAFRVDLLARQAGFDGGQDYADRVYGKRLAELTREERRDLLARLEASAQAA